MYVLCSITQTDATRDCGLLLLLFYIITIMISGERQKPVQKAARWPCGVCGRGVGSNSIQCTSCQKWVHKKCSGIKSNMYKVMKSFS